MLSTKAKTIIVKSVRVEGEFEWPDLLDRQSSLFRNLDKAVSRLPMIHKARTRISTVTSYDGVMGQSTGGRLQRIRVIVGTSAGTFRV